MRLVTSSGQINGKLVISIKTVVQVVILNSAVRYWIYKVWTAPGLTPSDQSAERITAEQVIDWDARLWSPYST